jgi:hypothetical protein
LRKSIGEGLNRMVRVDRNGLRRRLLATLGLLGVVLAVGCANSPTGREVEGSPPSRPTVVASGKAASTVESHAGGSVEALSPVAAPPRRAQDRDALPVRLAPGIEVDRIAGEVRVSGQAALDEGWLEQAVCLAGTREHESLVVIDSPPRLVHAALLMLGLEAGRPGSWRLEEDGETIRREPPTGSPIELHVRFTRADGVETTVPLSSWVETARGGSVDAHPWRFAGSRLDARRDGGESYAADFSGSVVGLVTFGDEVIAYQEVRSDQVEIEEAGFLVRRGAPPPPGTPVTLIFRTPRAP